MNRPPAFEFIPAPRERTAAAHVAGRGLHRAHFAFMRAVLQGLDPTTSWRRYLAGPDDRLDLRLVRSALQWVRDEFAAAALREQRPGTARLVLLDPGRWGTTLQDVPSLEAFASSEGLDGFSEAEQLEAYQARFGAAASRQRRAKRLLQRQLEALRWLESLSTQSPQLQDPLRAWLHPGLATRLSAAGMQTLGDLVERIQGRGAGWHRGIAAVGAGKAARILQWLRMQEVALGVRLGPHIDVPRSQWSDTVRQQASGAGAGVRPLEKLQLPPTLDGRAGRYRAPATACRLTAQDDLAAIQAWLGPPPGNTASHPGTVAPRPLHTYRAYRKEAERLLLWATVERGKPLSSLDAGDAQAYQAFLADPQPRERWCGPVSAGRWSSRWRPLAGPLSAVSRGHAVRVLRAMFAFLHDHGYVCQALFQEGAGRRDTREAATTPAKREERVLTFAARETPEAAWRTALYQASREAGWTLRQLCEARWCDLIPDPLRPGTWVAQLPPAQGPRRQRETAPLRLDTGLLRQGAALLGLADMMAAGPPVHPAWHLVAASLRAPPLLRRGVAPPGSGIRPATLRDQLRHHRG